LEGAAFAWAVRVTVDLILLLRAASVTIGVGLRDVLFSSFRATIVGALVGFPILILGRFGTANAGRIISVLIIELTGLVYFAVVAVMTLDTRDRTYLAPFWLRERRSTAT